MEYEKLLEMIAPCGLNCGKCLAYEHGEIRKHSQAIMELLGPNFDSYAERFTQMNPTFKNYQPFKELLIFLSEGSCGGCRKEGCLLKVCNVQNCVKEKGINFCFECNEFPCEKTGMPPELYEKWKNNNRMLKDLGVEKYYEKIKDLPRYP